MQDRNRDTPDHEEPDFGKLLPHHHGGFEKIFDAFPGIQPRYNGYDRYLGSIPNSRRIGKSSALVRLPFKSMPFGMMSMWLSSMPRLTSQSRTAELLATTRSAKLASEFFAITFSV